MKKFILSILILSVCVSIGFLLVKKSKKQSKNIRIVEVVDKKAQKANKEKKLFQTAETYIEASEYKEAKRVWKELIDTFPKSKYVPRACYELGKYYGSLKKEDIAITYFKKSISEFPEAEYSGYSIFELAKIDEANNKLDEALAKYKKIKEDYFFIDAVEQAVSKIADINMKLLFSNVKTKDSFFYEIKPGDTIFGIAKKYNNTVDYILEANSLSKKGVIHPGDRIKLLSPKLKFTIMVDKSQKVLTLKKNNDIIKQYKIAIGRDNATPEGAFNVQNKLKDPVWFSKGQAISADDPQNILGSRWIGFDKDLGIHGTTEKKEITTQQTSGCVRMYNKEVEQLYSILRIGDRVIIEG